MTTLSYTVPVAGSTLNSVADPEVATALSNILTWSSNIDTSNLSSTAGVLRSQLAGGFGDLAYNTIGTSTNAVDGNFYFVTATATLTLPSPTVNRTVGVFNFSTAATVTIATSSGVIAGVGTGSGGASSITLGTSFSAMVLLANGTNWYVVAGQQDTGWIALSLGSGMSAGSGYTPGCRMTGDRVFFKGSISQASGNAVTGLATLPAGITKPSSSVDMPAPAYNGSTYAAGLFGVNNSTGAVGYSSNFGSGAIYFLDGLSYSLS